MTLGEKVLSDVSRKDAEKGVIRKDVGSDLDNQQSQRVWYLIYRCRVRPVGWYLMYRCRVRPVGCQDDNAQSQTVQDDNAQSQSPRLERG